MNSNAVWSHFSNLAEQGVWASLYAPGTPVTAGNWSFLIRARRVIELLKLSGTAPKNLLDIGCGTAPLGPAIAAMGSQYTGIDFSEEMIASARANMADAIAKGSVRLEVGDATNVNLPDKTFDAIVAMGLIEYFSREQAQKVIFEIARVSLPGGIIIVTIPKRWCLGKIVNVAVTPLRKVIRWRFHSAHLKLAKKEAFERLYLTPGELDRMAVNAGLVKVDARHYNVQAACGPAISIAPRLCYLINRPFEWMARIPGGTFLATGYIGMYRRTK